MDDVTRLSRCARCGATLPAGAGHDLCATCRAEVSAAPDAPTHAAGGSETPTHLSEETGSDAPTIAGSPDSFQTFLSSEGAGPDRLSPGPQPTPGEAFGPYDIERRLGSGGMGDVYEAAHRTHGRRVAVKVLSQRLATSEDRARFLREGELAASITHPNTVYVYGSEEIDGAPVIAMELLSGGTLRDLVQQRGPLAPQTAVDLVLQVIAGLEAAGAVGILHRDIKPANCFIDRDGGVKVGDFGLSVAASGRENRASGMFQGTPQFAPPEQIQGEALDVRADIYAVGATLFYLLTGAPPFDDPDITTLISRVKMEAPRSPREMRAGVPVDLAAVVTRCLAKNREARPPSYAALRDLLRAFSSSAAAPAPLGRRFLAGAIDQVVVVAMNVLPAVFFVFRDPTLSSSRWTISIIQILSTALYYGLSEGLWGASVGKRTCGLVVRRTDGQPIRLAQGLGRGSIWVLSPMIMLIPLAIMGAREFTQFTIEHPGVTGLLSSGGLTLQVALLFSTARRRNGFAAIQDLVTGSRVIVQRPSAAEAAIPARALDAAPESQRGRRFGPFEVVAALGSTPAGPAWLARDPRLKRNVWIFERPAEALALPAVIRDMGRPSRLRWLNGQRGDRDSWDAFESSDGSPLVMLAAQPWRAVRHWLAELAAEIKAALADRSLPPLALDRVWITAAGHVRLLDFPAPGAPITPEGSRISEGTARGAQAFLAAVADRALSGSAPPGALPLSARSALDRLAAGGYATPDAVVAEFNALATKPDVVAPWRRATSIAIDGLWPVVFGLLGLVAAFVLRQAPVGAEALAFDLNHLSDLSTSPGAASDAERRALETYVAATYVSTIENELTWSIVSSGKPMRELRPIAVRVVAGHPHVTPEDLAAAKAAIGPFLEQEAKVRQGSDRRASIAPYVVPAYLFVVGLCIAAVLGVVCALVCRGGLALRSFGIAVVTREGTEATRLRATLRAFVAWAPAGLCVFGAWAAGIHFTGGYIVTHPVALSLAAVAFAIFVVGAIVAATRTAGGIQDSIAGTRLVPR